MDSFQKKKKKSFRIHLDETDPFQSLQKAMRFIDPKNQSVFVLSLFVSMMIVLMAMIFEIGLKVFDLDSNLFNHSFFSCVFFHHCFIDADIRGHRTNHSLFLDDDVNHQRERDFCLKDIKWILSNEVDDNNTAKRMFCWSLFFTPFALLFHHQGPNSC